MIKKVNKTVTFSSETEEQNLLKKVEQELSQQKYDSFSVLCKKALQAFLSNPESRSISNNQLQQTLNQVYLQLAQIRQVLKITNEQKLGAHLTKLTERVEQVDAKTGRVMKQLQLQINELKQVLSKSHNEQRENQLNDLLQKQKMEQINANLYQQLQQIQKQITYIAQTVSKWESRQLSPVRQPVESVNAETQGKKFREINESQTSHNPLSTSEELLIHLRPLLDDF